MDKEYIKEQITLMLMGEETDISEGEIRKAISADPELQKNCEETLLLMETAAKRTPPPVSAGRWAEFTAGLHQRLEQESSKSILLRIAEFFCSPVKATAAASIAAVLILGVALLLHKGEVTPTDVAEEDVIPETNYVSLEQIDESYQAAANLIPSYEELSLVEDVYADFTPTEEDIIQDTANDTDYEFEELKRYYNTNDNEDIS